MHGCGRGQKPQPDGGIQKPGTLEVGPVKHLGNFPPFSPVSVSSVAAPSTFLLPPPQHFICIAFSVLGTGGSLRASDATCGLEISSTRGHLACGAATATLGEWTRPNIPLYLSVLPISKGSSKLCLLVILVILNNSFNPKKKGARKSG